MKATHPLERRRIATEATMARFVGRPFEWGRHDCAKMSAFHMRQLGVSIGIAKAGHYRSALAAKAALKRMGAASLIEIADRHFARITPAAALLGDVMIAPSGDAFGALWICTGNSTVLGWHEEHEDAVIMRASFVDTLAWRLI